MMQISHLRSKLMGKMMFAGSLTAVAYGGIVTVDDIVTIEANNTNAIQLIFGLLAFRFIMSFSSYFGW